MSRRTISVISGDSILDSSARAERTPELDMGGIDEYSQRSTSPSKPTFLRAFDNEDDESDEDDHKPIIDLDVAIMTKHQQAVQQQQPQRVFGMSHSNNISETSHSGTSLLEIIPSFSAARRSPSKRPGFMNGIKVRNRENMPSTSTFAMLESRFHSLLISQSDLAFAPPDLIVNSAGAMRELEAELLWLLQSSEDTMLRSKAELLLNNVLQEADVYESALKLQDGEELETAQTLRHFPSTSDILPSAARTLSRTPSTDTLSSHVSQKTIRPPQIESSAGKTRIPLPEYISSRPASVATSSSANYAESSFPTIDCSFRTSFTASPGPNDVFQWTHFEKISHHIASESMRENVGTPTVLAVAGWIIIGTDKSAIVVYDLSQTLQSVLKDHSSAEYGPVTSISISVDQTVVVAGYGAGHIIIWDIQRRSIIKVISPLPRWDGRKDGHTLGFPVVHVGFIGGSNVELVSGDTQGAAFLHTLSKLVLVSTVASARIHGRPDALVKPIVPTTIFALNPMPHSKHILEQHGLVALSTPYKVAVIITRPVPQIIFKQAWAPEEERTTSASLAAKQAVACSCLAWSPLVTPLSQYNRPITDELQLAASSGFKLYIMQAKMGGRRGRRSNELFVVPQFVVLGEWVGPENIVAIQWLNPQLLLILTNHQDFIVFDISSMQAIERSSILPRQVVSHEFFTKAVSFGESFYASSIRMFKGRIFVLSQDDICMVQLVKWSDRLSSLAKVGNFLEALALGGEFYSGRFRRAAGSLPVDDKERRLQVATQLVNLLTAYVDMSLHAYDPQRDDTSLCKVLATVCFETCIAINRQDFLLSDIYDKFLDVDLEATYFETLEEYATRERLTNISNPIVVSSFIEYYQRKGWFARAEQVIFQLDPASIDVHGVLKLCRSAGLFNALIFVYNRALRDYISPVVEILRVIVVNDQVAGKQTMNAHDQYEEGCMEFLSKVEGWSESVKRDSIYALYVYLAYILTGKAFPVGVLPPKEALKAKTDVYNFLFSPYHAFWPPDGIEATLLRLGEPPFPYVRLLFRHDPREFLKVIGQVFEDSSLEGEIPAKDMFGLNRPGGYNVRDEVSRQFVAETLLSIVEKDDLTSDKIAVYAFLARNYARYTTFIDFSDDLLQKIVTGLASYTNSESKLERERAVMALLGRWKYHKSHQFVSIFRNAGFWKVCEAQYRQDEQYEKVLDCYLNDSTRIMETFVCIRELLSDKSILLCDRIALRHKVMMSLTKLVGIDAEMTAEIISEYFSDAHVTIMKELNAAGDDLEWQYLKGLLEPQRVIAGRTGRSDNATTNLPPEVYERYIELLCFKNPGCVLSYLVTVSDEVQGCPFSLERAFQICKHNNVAEAAVWALERSGDIHGALALILEELKTAAEVAVTKEIQAANNVIETKKYNLEHGLIPEVDGGEALRRSSIASSIRDLSTSPDRMPPGAVYTEDRRLRLEARRALLSVQDGVEASTQLCRRAANSLSKPARAELWFLLLDATVGPQQELIDGANSLCIQNESSYRRMLESFKALSRAVMSGMIGQVSLSSILQRLVNFQPNIQLGEHRALLEEMIRGHIHESETLKMAVRVAASDVDDLQRHVIRLRRVGIRPAKAICGICKKMLASNSISTDQMQPDNILVYKCRHAYHDKCMKEVISDESDSHSENGLGFECAMCRSPSGIIRKKRIFKADVRSKHKYEADDVLNRSKGKERVSQEDTESQILKQIMSKVESLDRFNAFDKAIPSSELLQILSPKTEEVTFNLNNDETEFFNKPATLMFGIDKSSSSYLEEDNVDGFEHVAQTYKLPSMFNNTKPRHRLILAPPSPVTSPSQNVKGL